MRLATISGALCTTVLLAGFARGADQPVPMNKTFVNDKGELDGQLVYTMVQVGGFVGNFGSSVVIEPNGQWTGARTVARQKTEFKGKLTPEQIKALGEALKLHDFAGLPQNIGPAEPLVSPRIGADGAATTMKLKIGAHEATSNSADGVDADEDEIALRVRLREIGNAILAATINAPAEK
jgi:hypothetical protein